MTKRTSTIYFLIVALMFAGSFIFSQETAYSKEDLPLAMLLYENRDGALAFQVFSELAKTGDADAIAWLGRCYLNGIGVKADDNKAFALFSRAAQMGNAWAINGMGVCYNYGRGTPKNLRLAIESYRKAAAMNHPLGTLNLARTLGFKEDGFYNPEKADETYKKAINLKAPEAELAYGVFLFEQKKYNEAIPFLEASGNITTAWPLLIQCYENGWGTPVDIRKAVQLAEDYAALNPSDAAQVVEVIYDAAWEEFFFKGRTDKSVNYIKQAANLGHNDAQLLYSSLLKEQNDTESAFDYARRAAEANTYHANLEAGILAKQLENFDIALKHLELATLEPDSEMVAIENLVNIYAYQLNQRPKSRHWAQRGAELGSAYCRNELAIDALNIGLPESRAKAYTLVYASHIDGNTTATEWLDKHLKDDYEMLRELADNGNADALVSLGLLGALNDKGHPNIPIGIELLEKAAELKCGVACRYLGNLFFNGVIIDKDLRKAFDWYKKGAELDDAICAHSVVSMLYNNEEFADIPFKECKKWCDISMQFDDSDAFMYGQILEIKGKDVESAKKMYEMAAMNNDPRAMIVLHDMLWDKDIALSISYLHKAVELHDSLALYRFGMINRLIMGQPRKAFIAYLQAFIAGNNTTAPYEIACCLLKGIGCSVNSNMALKMAEKAFENGEAQSCSLLGSLYMDGIVVPKNEAKAKQYFEEGVKRGDKESKKALGIPVKK